MKRTRFTDEQIVGILQEAAGAGAVREVCRRHGITETTFDRWRAKYGGRPKAEIRHCPRCGLTITQSAASCPLCQASLIRVNTRRVLLWSAVIAEYLLILVLHLRG